jgi:chitinase
MANYEFDMANGPSKYYSLAFVLADSKNQPSWNAMEDLSKSSVISSINKLRAVGGDVIISCGGANGQELGYAIKDLNSLVSAYQKVIDTFKLKYLDLDIEGGQLEEKTIDTRNKAIAKIQKSNPGLILSYTLSADSSGLNALSVGLLENAKKNGVRVDVVNAMCMSMGQDNGSAQIISAAKNAKAQVDKVGIGSKIGITIMLHTNDYGGPTTLEDAKKVKAFADQTSWVRLLSFWSVARDNGGCPGRKYADPSCSGATQGKYDFAKIFSA